MKRTKTLHTADPDLHKRWDGQYPSLWVTHGGGGTSPTSGLQIPLRKRDSLSPTARPSATSMSFPKNVMSATTKALTCAGGRFVAEEDREPRLLLLSNVTFSYLRSLAVCTEWRDRVRQKYRVLFKHMESYGSNQGYRFLKQWDLKCPKKLSRAMVGFWGISALKKPERLRAFSGLPLSKGLGRRLIYCRVFQLSGRVLCNPPALIARSPSSPTGTSRAAARRCVISRALDTPAHRSCVRGRFWCAGRSPAPPECDARSACRSVQRDGVNPARGHGQCL